MGITILDGGMGQELLARSGATPTPLWATRVMLDRPKLVREIHDDYFAAGATVATTNTYGLHRDRLAPHGLEEQLADLHRIACEMAVASRDAVGSGQVAGALGPLGWSYTTDAPPAHAAELFAEICDIQAPFVDLFLIETASSLAQARAAVDGARGHGKPVWLAVSVMDEDGTRLRSGEPVADVLDQLDGVDALFINCSTPEAVGDGLKHIASAPAPLGAYANGFTKINSSFVQAGATVQALRPREDLGPEAYADFAADWVRTGATIIGGCCEVGPAHIAELTRRFAA
ncbi:MAG: homocysteine S-methyltransferase family protein [Pseudomonadota bacterium]